MAERLIAVGEGSLTHFLPQMMPGDACQAGVKRDLSTPDRVAAKLQSQVGLEHSMPAAIALTLVFDPWQKRLRTRIGGSRQKRGSNSFLLTLSILRGLLLELSLWFATVLCFGETRQSGGPKGLPVFRMGGAMILLKSDLYIIFFV